MTHQIRRRTAFLAGAATIAAILGGTAVATAGNSRSADASSDGPGVYVSMTPARLLDTRLGNGTGGVVAPVGPNQTITVPVAGRAGIPADALGVALNVTLDNSTSQSYVTVWPSGLPRPDASTTNAQPNQVVPNMSISDLGADGAINVFNERGSTNVVIDAVGYMLPVSDFTSGAGNLIVANGAPSPTLGAPGDAYVDSSTGQLYGPKTGSGWGSPLQLGSVGPRGPVGAQGPAGPQGSGSGLVAGMSTLGTNSAPLTLAAGEHLPIDAIDVTFGSGITPDTTADTLTVANTGVYQLNYRLVPTLASTLGSVRPFVNGLARCQPVSLVQAGAQVGDTCMLSLVAGDVLDVRVATVGVTIAPDGAGIALERLN